MGAPGLSGGATVDTGRPDHEVQAAIILPTSTERYPSDWFAGLFARYTDSESNLRIRYLYQDNSPEVELWEIDAGRATLLDFVNLGPDALLPGSTHTLRVVVQGRQVVAYHDGVPVARGDDGPHPGEPGRDRRLGQPPLRAPAVGRLPGPRPGLVGRRPSQPDLDRLPTMIFTTRE